MTSRAQRKLFIVMVLAAITLAGFLSGMVLAGSVKRESGTLNISFVVTDNVHSVPVKYSRVLPDLFREGAGAVVVGRMGDNGEFMADEVLAKHDENYMPPEVAEALEKAREAQAR
jgi:cytochrome c-type biogenesis protein CcmE